MHILKHALVLARLEDPVPPSNSSEAVKLQQANNIMYK
jgi:hypothetical protein